MARLGHAFLRLSLLVVLMLSLFLLGGRPSPVHADVFTVTRTDDPAPNGCSAVDCSLREAIIVANGSGGSDIITLPAGTYTLSRAGHDNTASGGDLDITGGLFIFGAGAATTIIDGGAIDRVFDMDPEEAGVSVHVFGITIRNGDAGVGGGGILNRGTATLINVTLSGNEAGYGGGILNNGTATLSNVAVSGNIGTVFGGGIENGGTAGLTNVTISGNTGSYGGGIYNSGGTANLTNVTINGNTASDDGGGIYNHSTGTISLMNTIVANSPSGGDCSGTITSVGFNLDSDGTCGLSGAGDLSNRDPDLGPLANNGGATKTHALLPGSDAIDSGSSVGSPAVDQRGVARPADGNLNGVATCDRGAYELERKADITQYRPSNGTWYVRGFAQTQWGVSGDIPVPANYDGDFKMDIAQYRPSNGTWYRRGLPNVTWGLPADIPVPADYNRDGRAEIAQYRPSNGVWYIRGGGNFPWGLPADVPVPADYDGDGEAEIAMYRPSNGVWYIRGGGNFPWGLPGDVPVPADYDGDGSTEIAMYRPSNGTWYLRGGPTVKWGRAGDIPVPGDYNENGRANMAVWRPSDGVWYVRGSSNVHWGHPGDTPVPADYY